MSEHVEHIHVNIKTSHPPTQVSQSTSQSYDRSTSTSESSLSTTESESSGTDLLAEDKVDREPDADCVDSEYNEEDIVYEPSRSELVDHSEPISGPGSFAYAESLPAPRPQGRRSRTTDHIHTTHRAHRAHHRRERVPPESAVDDLEGFPGYGQPFPQPHQYSRGGRPPPAFPPNPVNAFGANPFVPTNPPQSQIGRVERFDPTIYNGYGAHPYSAPPLDPRASYFHHGHAPLPHAPSPFQGHEILPYGDPRYNYPNPYPSPYGFAGGYMPRPTTGDPEIVAPVKVPTPAPVVDPAVEQRAKELEATIKELQALTAKRDAKDAAEKAAAQKAEEDALQAKLLRLQIENEQAQAREAALAAAKAAAEEEALRKAETERKVAEEVSKAKIAFEAAAAKAKADEEAAKQAAADAKVAADLSYRAAVKEAEEKIKADAAKAAEEAAKQAPPPAPAPAPEKKKPIKFKDAVGRKFSFPFHLCATWAGMEDLILQAFLHVEKIGDHVAAGHYDLVGPNGEIILPQVWETMIEPDWNVVMHLWPIPEPPPPTIINVAPPGTRTKGGSRPKNPGGPTVPAGGFPGGAGGLPPGISIVKKPTRKKASPGIFGGFFGSKPKKSTKKPKK